LRTFTTYWDKSDLMNKKCSRVEKFPRRETSPTLILLVYWTFLISG